MPGDYLNSPWSQHASQNPGSMGDAEFCIPSPPIKSGYGPLLSRDLYTKGKLLPSHHTMMARCRIIAFKIPIWKREEWRHSSLWSITWKKSQQTLLKTFGSDSEGKFLLDPGLAVLEEPLCFLFLVALTALWELLSFLLYSIATSQVGIGKYVLRGSYITFPAYFLLVQV